MLCVCPPIPFQDVSDLKSQTIKSELRRGKEWGRMGDRDPEGDASVFACESQLSQGQAGGASVEAGGGRCPRCVECFSWPCIDSLGG